jgi:hypothetical protein
MSRKDGVKKPYPGKLPKQVKSLMRRYRKVKDKRMKASRFPGRCTGLGLFRFLAQVFDNNEKAPREDKLTNEAITAMLMEEFPHNKELIKGFKEGKRTLNYYRDLYNRGRLTNDEPPPSISFRYNSDGLAVELRHGRTLLSITERQTYARKFFGIHSALKAKEPTHVESPEEPNPPPDP